MSDNWPASPPLSVGQSAGAGGGLVFNMEKEGHSAGWERSVQPIPPVILNFRHAFEFANNTR